MSLSTVDIEIPLSTTGSIYNVIMLLQYKKN